MTTEQLSKILQEVASNPSSLTDYMNIAFDTKEVRSLVDRSLDFCDPQYNINLSRTTLVSLFTIALAAGMKFERIQNESK